MSSYTFMGCLGFGVGYCVVLLVVLQRGWQVELPGIILVTSVVTLIITTLLTLRITGKETLVLYRQLLLTVGANAAIASFLSASTIDVIDLSILGFAGFSVFGRLGCTMVGCCHGRPVRRGLTYGTSHATSGFTEAYVGVSLFPLQIIGASFHLVMAVMGAWLIVSESAQGTFSVVYISSYGVFRFASELARGDTVRPHVAGLSEAQWTSAITVIALGILSALLEVPCAWLAFVASGLVLVSAIIIIYLKQSQPRNALTLNSAPVLHALHTALDARQVPFGQAPLIRDTPVGIRFSVARKKLRTCTEIQYGFSQLGGSLSPKTASRITHQARLRHRPEAEVTEAESQQVPGLHVLVIRIPDHGSVAEKTGANPEAP